MFTLKHRGNDQFFYHIRSLPHALCRASLCSLKVLATRWSISVTAEWASQWMAPHTNLTAFQREAELTRTCVGVHASRRKKIRRARWTTGILKLISQTELLLTHHLALWIQAVLLAALLLFFQHPCVKRITVDDGERCCEKGVSLALTWQLERSGIWNFVRVVKELQWLWFRYPSGLYLCLVERHSISI